MMDERFLTEIARAMRRAGYSDRSKFIRDAVFEKLKRAGVIVDYEMAMAPPRAHNLTIINGGAHHTVNQEAYRANETPGGAVPEKLKKVKYSCSKKRKG